MSSPVKNEYLNQVIDNQQRLENDLKAKRRHLAVAGAVAAPAAVPRAMAELEMDAQPVRQQAAPMLPRQRAALIAPAPAGGVVDVRVTGWWRWQTVVVPPNAYVVHTRRGRAEPVNIGLGVSFRYNPNTDSFLVVPGAMQTLLINAQCICRELQGVLVQGYVQWIIDDFATAYRKLDFSDAEDPMRVVNVQLREQAEAAIKDKVATMSISDVLSDKQPIIEELTARLRAVAEGAGKADSGLGLRIVTVQIKEAVVSSATLWESLQKPFRAERERIARLAQLEAEQVVERRESEVNKAREQEALAQEAELNALRAQKELERAEREQADARSLAEEANQTALHAAKLEAERLTAESEVAARRLAEEASRQRAGVEAQLALDALREKAAHARALSALEVERLRAQLSNDLSPAALQARLLEALPLIADKLPKPAELRAVSIGEAPAGAQGAAALASLVAELMTLLEAARSKTPKA